LRQQVRTNPEGRVRRQGSFQPTNRLAELASGALFSHAQEQVDQARCRMWAEHNRDYAKLDESRCADLIESFRAPGRQDVPAIVRRMRGDPDVNFEVIYGARRH
jgi:ParB family chromosome partitioning protein